MINFFLLLIILCLFIWYFATFHWVGKFSFSLVSIYSYFATLVFLFELFNIFRQITFFFFFFVSCVFYFDLLKQKYEAIDWKWKLRFSLFWSTKWNKKNVDVCLMWPLQRKICNGTLCSPACSFFNFIKTKNNNKSTV